MSDIDFDAVVAAVQDLTVCFIIVILAVNSVFILKILRKGKVIMYKPKSLTMISLAIGDIFLALFSLVYEARLAFQDGYPSFHESCSLHASAYVYREFLISFVYGVGLVMLAVELNMRQIAVPSPINTNKNIAKAVAFSATPWLFGLVVVLPLTMATMNWEKCETTADIARAHYWVSLCLPATSAFIACGYVFCTKSPDPTTQILMSPMAARTTSEEPPSYPGEDETNDSINSNQRPAADSYGVTAPLYTDQSPVVSPPSASNIPREKKLLMCASIIYCVCVIPYAGYCLSAVYFNQEGWSIMARLTVAMVFRWLLVCRSVIVPLLWVIWSTD